MAFAPTPRTKIALDNNKLNLSAPSTEQGKTATLIWGLVKNNPRITVWTRDSQDMTEKNGNGRIQAELDSPILLSIIETLDKLINEAPGTRYKLENSNFTWFGGKRSDAPAVLTELWVGKDKEGYVYLSLTAPNRPIIKFRIAPSSFHTWYTHSGEKVSPEELCKTYVKGYLNILRGIYNHLAVTEFVDVQAEKAAKQGQGGNGGGKQWSGNNQSGGGYKQSNDGGSAKSNAGFGGDDDLPF